MAEGLSRVGRLDEGLALIDEALGRCSRNGQLWCLPDLFRVKGTLILGERTRAAAAVAEGHFVRGLEPARRQGALSWELRCATSLARLLRDQGRNEAACTLLGQVYHRFTEGFATSDLRAAKVLIAELS